MADVPHFAFPFERTPDGKNIQVVEQGTLEHIVSQEYVVISTPQGSRDSRPDFGWPWPEFANAPIDTTALEDALRRFVPDSDADVTEWADEISEATRHIRVQQEG
jgi:hypothetical protein